MRYFLTLFVLMLASQLSAVITFERTYGGELIDCGASVQQTTDGGYIIAGWVEMPSDPGWTDVWLVKTDSSGDMLWNKVFHWSGYHDPAASIDLTLDGGYIIAGYRDGGFSPLFSDVWLIKTDSIGDTVWTRAFGGDSADLGKSVQQTTDGGYIITGWTESYSCTPGTSDVWLIKTDSLGDTLWTKTYGGDKRDVSSSVQQTTDGGYIIAGGTASYSCTPGTSDVWLIKTDANGDTLWTRTFGGDSTDGGCSVQQTSDGGYIIVGSTKSYGAGNYDVYLIKTDLLGNVPAGIEEVDYQPRITNHQFIVSPNPFWAHTKIYGAEGEVEIYDLSGRVVGRTDKGIWDGRNFSGKEVQVGIYFLKVQDYKPVKIVKLR